MKETFRDETKYMMRKVKGERKGEVEAGNKSGNGWCMDVRNVGGQRATYGITNAPTKDKKWLMSEC